MLQMLLMLLQLMLLLLLAAIGKRVLLRNGSKASMSGMQPQQRRGGIVESRRKTRQGSRCCRGVDVERTAWTHDWRVRRRRKRWRKRVTLLVPLSVR